MLIPNSQKTSCVLFMKPNWLAPFRELFTVHSETYKKNVMCLHTVHGSNSLWACKESGNSS